MASDSDQEAFGLAVGLEHEPKTPSQSADTDVEDSTSKFCTDTPLFHLGVNRVAETDTNIPLSCTLANDHEVYGNELKNVHDSPSIRSQTEAHLFLDDKSKSTSNMREFTGQISGGLHEDIPAMHTVVDQAIIDRPTESTFATPESKVLGKLRLDDDDPFPLILKRGSRIKSTVNTTSTVPMLTPVSDTKIKQEMDEDLTMDTDGDHSTQEYDVDGTDSEVTDSDDSVYMQDVESDYGPSPSDEDDDTAHIAQRRAAMQRINARQEEEDDDEDKDSDEAFPSIQKIQFDLELEVLRGIITRRDHLRSKQTSGHLTAAQKAQLQILDKKIQSDRKRLNIPEDKDITASGTSFGANTLQKNGSNIKSTKQRRFAKGRRAKNAKEWFLKHGTDLHVLEGSKKRKQSRPDESATSSAKRQKKSNLQPSKPKQDQVNGRENLFESMLNNDPIQAHQKWGDISETEVKATNKRDQLQQLTDGAATGYANKASDKRKLEIASRAFGFGKCVAKNGKWKLEGMKSSLLNHQVTGGAWMLRREFSQDGILGGILADEMGMGKTVSMLSCIVSNQPTPTDLERYSKATLVIMPATAIRQWNEQIALHVQKTHIKDVLLLKNRKDLPKSCFESADIIIASYNEVASQYPTKKSQNDLYEKLKGEGLDADELEEQFEAEFSEAQGPLFKIPFWRIVLDEAHVIKNKYSRSSMACRALKGRHRWVMTATPLQNSVDELFPYMNFLRVPQANSTKEFSKAFGKIKCADALARLHEILPELMLRRTSSDKFMGKPHFVLPQPHDDVMYIDLTQEETVIYKEIEKSFREAINRSIENDDTESKEKNILALITNLRMATTHPFLLENVLCRVVEKANIESIQKQLNDIGVRQPVYKQIGVQIENMSGNSTTPGISGKSMFGSYFDMHKQLDVALAVQREGACRICLETPTQPKRAECGHIFCTDCIDSHIDASKERKDGMTKCPECKTLFADLTDVDDELFDEDDSDTEPTTSSSTQSQQNWNDPLHSARRNGRRLGNDILHYQPKLETSNMRFFYESDRMVPPESITPSAKTTAIRATTLKWLREAPDDKILIFSQFNKMSVIIGRMLQAEKIPFLYFDGGLTSVQKQKVIEHFHNKSNIKVMIVSLKCGGVALNLTCANRVILSDLWWNTSIEQQAFGRVFRYGQQKQTYFQRIVANNTIDQRMIALQSKKSAEIMHAMENGTFQNKAISFEDGASLLGRVVKDRNGNIKKVVAHDDN